MRKDSFKEPGNKEDLMWITDKSESILKTPIFSVVKTERRSRDGLKSGSFIQLHTANWIVVIPWFRDECGTPRFILEAQYRHGNNRVTWEFPGGLVEEGEESIKAAERELMEETGLKGKLTLLGEVSPNAAFMDNRQSFYLAEDLVRVSAQDLDENEVIDVFSRPVEEVLRDMGTGIYDNGIMMIAVAYFMRYAEAHPYLRE